MRTKARKCRSKDGFSITELMVTSILLVFAMAVIGELAVVTTMGSVKMTNKVDGLAAARAAISRISTDVRHARAIGDYYGTGANRLQFPAPTNPIYNATTPLGGWPSAPWNPAMAVSDNILVLQIPVLYQDPLNDNNTANGFPIMLPQGHFGPNNPPYNMENLDTVVYEVVPDQERPGEYLLQVARFPGEQLTGLNSKYSTPINPPQTILKGLIGPTSNNGSTVPSVFSYLYRNQKTYSSKKAYTPSSFTTAAMPLSAGVLDSILGIGIDLEVKRTGLDTSQGDGQYPQFFGIHSEAFMRSNREMRLNNTTAAP